MEESMAFQFLGGFAIFFILFFGAFFLAAMVFWVWMLVDCIQRPFPPAEQNAKIIWILVIVLTHWLGALLYYLIVKRAKGHP